MARYLSDPYSDEYVYYLSEEEKYIRKDIEDHVVGKTCSRCGRLFQSAEQVLEEGVTYNIATHQVYHNRCSEVKYITIEKT